MQPSLEDYLAFEVKKEMADRYFGFRRMIEEDKEELARKIRNHSLTLEQKIAIDLIRLYILLQDTELIRRFVEMVGLDEMLFFDPYILVSPTIKERMFAGVKARGLTRAGRFKNLFFGCYEMLIDHVQQYREKIGDLIEEREIINEEITLFYRKNDLSQMMGFFRSLKGNPMGSSMEGGLEVGLNDSMEKSMRLDPLPPIEQMVQIIPPLAPLAGIRKKLTALVERAYHLKSQRDSP